MRIGLLLLRIQTTSASFQAKLPLHIIGDMSENVERNLLRVRCRVSKVQLCENKMKNRLDHLLVLQNDVIHLSILWLLRVKGNRFET